MTHLQMKKSRKRIDKRKKLAHIHKSRLAYTKVSREVRKLNQISEVDMAISGITMMKDKIEVQQKYAALFNDIPPKQVTG
jgi:phage shock protein A